MPEKPSNSPKTQVSRWLAEFSTALNGGEITRVGTLFNEECFWRDLLAFTWNVVTMEGKEQISAMLAAQLAGTLPVTLAAIEDPTVDGETIDAWFTLETKVARGRGHLRLVNGRCWTLLTTIDELKGHEEKKGSKRVQGVEHRARKDRVTWLEELSGEQEELGTSRQPYCVIVGGGQGGIMLGARLRKLDVPTIVLEKNEHAGDSWRNRYRSLVLHDPVWYDHLPYLPFPEDWPVFTPKDKMGDWLEMYTRVMELNYWTSSECTGASYDAGSKKWTVEVSRDGQEIVLHPDQLIIATGAYGFAKIIDFAGADDFSGETLHTSQYRDGARFRGKRCAVIGSASSAHDVCVDLWENDAQVTMIQRSPSIVAKSESLMKFAFADLYSEEAVAGGITTEKADLMFASVPFRLMPQFQAPLYDAIRKADAEFYQRLSEAGFLWDLGADDSD